MNKYQLKKFEKQTQYDLIKEKNKNNFLLINETACKSGQIVLAGDSITELYNLEFLHSLEEKCKLRIYNRGISGDTSNRLYERFEENVLNIKPRAVVLLIGINDLSRKSGWKYVASNIEKIINAIKDNDENTLIILESVYPVNTLMNKGLRFKNIHNEIKCLNEEIFKLSEKYKTGFVDLSNVLSDSSGMFAETYTYDGLHPNASGYRVISSHIEKALENLLEIEP